MRSSRYSEARDCGAVRTSPKAPKATRYSGRAVIDIQYPATGESFDTDESQYAWTIWVDGRRVNACAHGLPGCPPPEWERATPEAYDDNAAAALRWTAYELDENPDSPGMDSGMDREDFENALDWDANCEIMVRRTR